jgi:hypothetical protein
MIERHLDAVAGMREPDDGDGHESGCYHVHQEEHPSEAQHVDHIPSRHKVRVDPQRLHGLRERERERERERDDDDDDDQEGIIPHLNSNTSLSAACAMMSGFGSVSSPSKISAHKDEDQEKK